MRMYHSNTDQLTNLLQLLCCVFFSFHSALSLVLIMLNISFFLGIIQQLCPNQAFLVLNALFALQEKNFEGLCSRVLHHKHFH